MDRLPLTNEGAINVQTTNQTNGNEPLTNIEQVPQRTDNNEYDLTLRELRAAGLANLRAGSRRRKSSVVKRVREDQTSSDQHPPLVVNNESGGTAKRGCNSSHEPIGKGKDSVNQSAVTKILQPIRFSATIVDDVQEVDLTFSALRANGEEVTVDNKFLKANYPLLLIDFYEKRLRYPSGLE